MNKVHLLSRYLLGGIVLLALCVRLYKITSPILDWHSFRQADTASVTREFVKQGMSILEPRYHDLSNIQSGQDNLEGYRMVEFPLLNAGIALLLAALPLSLTVVSRVVSVLFSLGSIVVFYYFIARYYGKKTAVIGTLTMAVLPYWIYYSRTVLPEPAMLFFSLLALLSFSYWSQNKSNIWYCVSLVAFATALLLKPYVIFLFPLYLAVAYSEQKLTLLKNPFFYLYPILGLLPLIWWREWITQYPAGIPANQWLLNGDNIRLRPAWFRWLGYERLTKLFLGYTGITFFIASFVPITRKQLIHYSWWLGLILYMVVFATGNVRHDYYQVLLVPAVCLSVALGIQKMFTLLAQLQDLSKRLFPNLNLSFLPLPLIFTSTIYVVMLGFGWWQIKEFYHINHPEYLEAGTAVDQLLPEHAKVIAPAFGDTQFLFQTNRTGWPIGFEIEDKIAKGATHYVTTSYDDEARALETEYFIVEKSDDFLILDLTRKKEPDV